MGSRFYPDEDQGAGRSPAHAAAHSQQARPAREQDLARPSHHGQARHRIGRSAIRQEKAAERSLGYGQGLRRRGRPARCDPKGGVYRTTGCVKALARCEGIAPRAFPGLSSDIHRAAPVHDEKSGLCDVDPIGVELAQHGELVVGRGLGGLDVGVEQKLEAGALPHLLGAHAGMECLDLHALGRLVEA